MLEKQRIIFIVGSPRSGTTWLQFLVSSHPKVLTGVENSLFSNYIGPIDKTWNKEVKSPFSRGLPRIISEKDFQLTQEFSIRKVYESFFKSEEDEMKDFFILDKNPGNVFWIETIWKYLPDAKIVHIIRDGREAVTSWKFAKKNMQFGYDEIRKASMEWRDRVEAGIKYRGNSKYKEIKYEDLLDNTEIVLKEVLDFFLLKLSDESIKEIVKNNSFESHKSQPKTLHKDYKADKIFYRSGQKDTWKNEMSLKEKYLFNVIAGDLLFKLEYESNPRWWCKNLAQYYGMKIYFKLKKTFYV